MDARMNYTNLIKLLIDAGIFAGFLISMEPRLTGIPLHEWLTVAGTAAFITHLLLNWSWVVQITRRFLSRVTPQARVNYVLNWLLFVDGVLIMFTGVMISKAVLPALGVQMPMNMFWRNLHSVTADLFIFILGLHLALHWNWVVNCVKRYAFQPVARLWTGKRAEQKEVQA